MKFLSISASIFIMFLGTSKCSETQKEQQDLPFSVGDVYVKEWASPIKSVGSGFNIFIPFSAQEKGSITLDSVYFRNQSAKLVKKVTDSSVLYIGQFKNPQKTNGDIVLSSDPLEEMKHNMPKEVKKSPFQLEENECMVRYIKENETKYYLIKNVVLKQSENNSKPMQIRQ